MHIHVEWIDAAAAAAAVAVVVVAAAPYALNMCKLQLELIESELK